MLVVIRLRDPELPADTPIQGAADPAASAPLRGAASALLDVLAERSGFLHGHLGRAVDDPGLWLLSTQWAGVGAYRRALSSYDVKVTAPAAMAFAVTEPSAYEVIESR